MKKYLLKIAIPSRENRWEASVTERTIEAENFNQMLMRAITPDELQAGARIFEIEELAVMVKSFYFPLTVYCYNSGRYEGDECDEKIALIYRSYIEKAFSEYQGEDVDMAKYFGERRSKTASKKTKRIEWKFEETKNRLYGRVDVLLTEELTADETEALKDWICGQNSDGLGEGFEQREFRAGDMILSVCFWNSSDDYRIYDETEFNNLK